MRGVPAAGSCGLCSVAFLRLYHLYLSFFSILPIFSSPTTFSPLPPPPPLRLPRDAFPFRMMNGYQNNKWGVPRYSTRRQGAKVLAQVTSPLGEVISGYGRNQKDAENVSLRSPLPLPLPLPLPRLAPLPRAPASYSDHACAPGAQRQVYCPSSPPLSFPLIWHSFSMVSLPAARPARPCAPCCAMLFRAVPRLRASRLALWKCAE